MPRLRQALLPTWSSAPRRTFKARPRSTRRSVSKLCPDPMRNRKHVRGFCSAVATAILLMTAEAGAAPPSKPIEAASVKLGHPVDFEKDVYPILEANCLACHNAAIAE